MSGRSRTASAQDSLQRELNAERVAALTRIARTLEALIAEMHAAAARLRQRAGQPTDWPERARELAAFRELGARARLYRWYLEVQREAVGLHRHDVLDEIYRLPTLD